MAYGKIAGVGRGSWPGVMCMDAGKASFRRVIFEDCAAGALRVASPGAVTMRKCKVRGCGALADVVQVVAGSVQLEQVRVVGDDGEEEVITTSLQG